MTWIGMKPAIVAAALALLTTNVNAFTSPLGTATARVSASGKFGLRMAEDESIDKVQLTSARKEVIFDEEKGRFFETSLETEECIPEEEFCSIDDDGKKIRLTVAEKERIFLDALQSYYVNGRQLLPDNEFDLLKEDLQWNGSPLVVLNRNEAKYLAGMEAYLKGTPIMSDKEFDDLKRELKETGSKFAVDTEPKCYIDTGVCKVTLQEDKFRSNLLYLPAGIVLFVAWIGLGFEIIEPIIRINPIILAALGFPLYYDGAKKITEEFLFENKFIAYGPCPSCEYENRVYFGNILGVEGFGDQADVKCKNCKEVFTVQRKSLRASTVPKN